MSKAEEKTLNNIEKLNIQTSMEIITISKMVRNIENGAWDTDPAYQRGYKWSPKNKHELITSLLKGIPLPLFYLRGKGDKMEVLDGKQRSLTIYNFVQNKFAYNPGGGQLIYFRNLSKEMQREILDTNIAIRYLNNTSDAAAIDVFIALQNGQRIKTEEMRHALGGSVIETIKEIYDKTEINKIHAFSRSTDYTKHETLLTKWMYLEHVLKEIEYNKNADIIDDNALYNMVKKYVDEKVSPTIKNTIIKRVKSIKFAYKDVKNVLQPQMPMVYGSYLLAARLQDQYGLDEITTGNLIYAFTQYVQNLRVDYIAKIKDWGFEEQYPEADHQWYRMTMENFGTRGTAKTEVHIYTQWFEMLWKQFESLYGKEFKKQKRTLHLF